MHARNRWLSLALCAMFSSVVACKDTTENNMTAKDGGGNAADKTDAGSSATDSKSDAVSSMTANCGGSSGKASSAGTVHERPGHEHVVRGRALSLVTEQHVRLDAYRYQDVQREQCVLGGQRSLYARETANTQV